MNDQTLTEIYELSGYEPQVIIAQMVWASDHKGKEERKLAAQEWGRSPKALAFVWQTWEVSPEMSRHELMSLIAIAGLNKFERPLLYEQWKSHTMSYEDVRDAVQARKKRASKAAKEPKLAERLQSFICELRQANGHGAEPMVYATRQAIADKLETLLPVR